MIVTVIDRADEVRVDGEEVSDLLIEDGILKLVRPGEHEPFYYRPVQWLLSVTATDYDEEDSDDES